MKVAIVEYGMGNIKSIASTLTFLGVNDVVLTSSHEELSSADKIILPGVGAFGEAMEHIRNKKLDTFLRELTLENKKPLLGICLGMQLLAKSSTEGDGSEGLGLIDGVVNEIDVPNVKVPHVGFNQVKVRNDLKLYDGLEDEVDFYFTHSYKMTSAQDINQSMCFYGQEFIASYEQANIVGVQFHPELSQLNGLKVLKNFLEKV